MSEFGSETTAKLPPLAFGATLTRRQLARFERAFDQIAERRVPCYRLPLCVADDAKVQLRRPNHVLFRISALYFVFLRSHEDIRESVEDLGEDLLSHFTARERAFLMSPTVEPDEADDAAWNLEALWTLLWSVGRVDTLDWPAGMCDVDATLDCASELLEIVTFQLRPKTELLDAQQLTMLIHWAIRQAMLDEKPLPAGLDWRDKSEWMPIPQSAAAGVVARRHRALNWLLDAEADWDDVDTST